MVKALTLVFAPAYSWEKIEDAEKGVGWIFLSMLLPVALLGCAGEAWLLTRLGLQAGFDRVVRVAPEAAVFYGALQFFLGIVTVFVAAKFLQSIALGSHGRPPYAKCFTLVAYSYGPHFLFRLLDGAPGMNTWLCWVLGMIFVLKLLYSGLPPVIKPDPVRGFGIVVGIGVFILSLSGIIHFVAGELLLQKVKGQ